MNEILQKHGCSNIFSIPEGLRELMADITREVLREQPDEIYTFITNYLSALLITREHGTLSMRILDDLCNCRPTILEHLLDAGLSREDAQKLVQLIQSEIESHEPKAGKETVMEAALVRKILDLIDMDEETLAKVCQTARNAFRDYYYRKEMLIKRISEVSEEPWERAVENTLRIYKTTKPTFSELHRAAKVIQAAYRGYHLRRQTLMHLRKPPKPYSGQSTPIDVAGSREMDLGSLVNVDPGEDLCVQMYFEDEDFQQPRPAQSIKRITYIRKKSSQLVAKSVCSMSMQPRVGVKSDYDMSTAGCVISTASKTQVESEVTKSQVQRETGTVVSKDGAATQGQTLPKDKSVCSMPMQPRVGVKIDYDMSTAGCVILTASKTQVEPEVTKSQVQRETGTVVSKDGAATQGQTLPKDSSPFAAPPWSKDGPV